MHLDNIQLKVGGVFFGYSFRSFHFTIRDVVDYDIIGYSTTTSHNTSIHNDAIRWSHTTHPCPTGSYSHTHTRHSSGILIKQIRRAAILTPVMALHHEQTASSRYTFPILPTFTSQNNVQLAGQPACLPVSP